MTARHQIRLGSRRLGRDRPVIDAAPPPSVGEMLQAARERKGVDLYRAERDTKIRLKYLAALEDGDYAELPPPVYTKGFIRNYALYLGLEPEEVIARWREEIGLARRPEKVVVAPPPQPITAPPSGIAITPGMIVALMLSLAVLAFLGYLGWQLLRFAEAPAIALTYPPSHVSEMNAETVTLVGTAAPGARVTVQAADGQTFNTIASNVDGGWSQAVPLSVGRNQFTIVATDPVTERDSQPLNILITVPLPELTSPPESPSPSPRTIAISLTSPTEGATSVDGTVEVRGTTSGTRITITAEYMGPLDGGASPAPETPAPGASPEPGPEPPAPLDISVPVGGSFSQQLQLPSGRWAVTVTSFATGVEPRSETRTVSVDASAIGEGAMTLVIEARGGNSWMRIFADGEQVPPREWGGPTLRSGRSVTVNADAEIYFRVGNAGVVHLTLNGRDLGMLGSRGQVGRWIIVPGSDPVPTTENR